jgi:hypothetical protein
MSTRIGKTPFVEAEIVDPATTGTEITYSIGRNNSGTNHVEVCRIIRHPDGAKTTDVIMRGSGLSQTKAEAIVMILNADA